MTGRVVKLNTGRSAHPERAGLPSACLGKLEALALPTQVWVTLPGTDAAVLASIGMDCDEQRLQSAVDQQQPAVLIFEQGDSERPILIGIIAPIHTEPRQLAELPQGFAVEADADGRRIRLQAQEEVILQCGDASISLKRNGRVVIRGASIETNAKTTNRIKGGSVRIN